MKPLRNPIVVGALAVIAIALVIYQLTPQLRRRSAARKSPPVTIQQTQATTSPASVVAGPDVAPGTAANSSGMDLVSIRKGASRWLESPLRDPFKVRFFGHGTNTPPASKVLTLAAVWHQDQSLFAVINQTILREGDPIHNFTLSKIEPSGVWVEGPNGREFVGFKVGPAEVQGGADVAPPVSMLPNVSPPQVISRKPVP